MFKVVLKVCSPPNITRFFLYSHAVCPWRPDKGNSPDTLGLVHKLTPIKYQYNLKEKSKNCYFNVE